MLVIDDLPHDDVLTAVGGHYGGWSTPATRGTTPLARSVAAAMRSGCLDVPHCSGHPCRLQATPRNLI